MGVFTSFEICSSMLVNTQAISTYPSMGSTYMWYRCTRRQNNPTHDLFRVSNNKFKQWRTLFFRCSTEMAQKFCNYFSYVDIKTVWTSELKYTQYPFPSQIRTKTNLLPQSVWQSGSRKSRGSAPLVCMSNKQHSVGKMAQPKYHAPCSCIHPMVEIVRVFL